LGPIVDARDVLGTLNLLQALAAAGFTGRLVHAGTGDVYGLVPESDLPVAEGRLPKPRNPYAVSKLAAEALCWQWHASEGMDVVLARSFNHIGWGQSDRFVVASLARQLVEIRRGARPPVIEVGDLDATRDFTDVDDVAAAYLALLDLGKAGEVYNVCSGIEHRIGDLLGRLIAMAGVGVAVEQVADRVRPSEQRRMRGDAGRICMATGWRATTPIETSLRSALDYWQGQLDR
jgi:GDP-4-dehydro-6-deoxy-D-mannose reductase